MIRQGDIKFIRDNLETNHSNLTFLLVIKCNKQRQHRLTLRFCVNDSQKNNQGWEKLNKISYASYRMENMVSYDPLFLALMFQIKTIVYLSQSIFIEFKDHIIPWLEFVH